jgi:hypothetical protein
LETTISKHRRGRSVSENDRRNECLIDTYIFLLLWSGYRYDLIVKNLANHFFLSEVTVQNILLLNSSKVLHCKKSYQDMIKAKLLRHLRTKWIQYNWDEKRTNTTV